MWWQTLLIDFKRHVGLLTKTQGPVGICMIVKGESNGTAYDRSDSRTTKIV